MDCKHCKTLIDEYIFDELSVEERKKFEESLINCPNCQEQLKKDQILIKAYQKNIGIPDFKKLHKNIITNSYKKNNFKKLYVYIPAIAATIILFIGLSIFNQKSDNNMILVTNTTKNIRLEGVASKSEEIKETIALNEEKKTPIKEMKLSKADKKINDEQSEDKIIEKSVAVNKTLREKKKGSFGNDKNIVGRAKTRRKRVAKSGVSRKPIKKSKKKSVYKKNRSGLGRIATGSAPKVQKDNLKREDNLAIVRKKDLVKKKYKLDLDEELDNNSALENEKKVTINDDFDSLKDTKSITKSVATRSVSNIETVKISEEDKIRRMFKNKKYKNIVQLLKSNHKKEYEKRYYYKSLLKLKKCDILKKIKNLSKYLTKSELESYNNCK